MLAAIAEYDALGAEKFRSKYGFKRARRYVLIHAGQSYDSKAVMDVAHRYAHGEALDTAQLSDGDSAGVHLLSALGFDVRDKRMEVRSDAERIFGEIAGVSEGKPFADRQEVMDEGIHRALIAGIVGNGPSGAESVVVSGGYEDDEDHGWLIIYTGHGGQDGSGRQIADQSFESSGNAALKTSNLTGTPLRLVRGAQSGSPYAPAEGYRYEGLFRVEDAWREEGRSGYQVCRYRLVKLEAATPELPVEPVTEHVAHDVTGNRNPERRGAFKQRIVRSTVVADYVKKLYDHTCQACAVRLAVGARGYSEGAHIQALGRPHSGPDIPANVLCLCPNCHILFDAGALVIDEDFTVVLDGERLRFLDIHPSHAVDHRYLAYHRSIHE